LPVDVAMPEDGVADEAVVPAAVEEAPQLALAAGRIEPPPDDRVEARVPIPLPGVVPRAWPRVAVVDAIALALDPVAAERLLGDAEDPIRRTHAVIRCIPRSAKKVKSAPSPIRASSPGQVSCQVTDPMKPWRAASTTWVTGLIRAIVWSQPWSSAIGA